jgi:hypothetical protein
MEGKGEEVWGGEKGVEGDSLGSGGSGEWQRGRGVVREETGRGLKTILTSGSRLSVRKKKRGERECRGCAASAGLVGPAQLGCLLFFSYDLYFFYYSYLKTFSNSSLIQTF